MVSGKYPKYYKRKSWYNIRLFKTLRAWKTCGVFFCLVFLSIIKMNKNNFMQEFIMLYATTDHAQIVF